MKHILERNTILECNITLLSQCSLSKLEMARPSLHVEKNEDCLKRGFHNFEPLNTDHTLSNLE